MSITDFDVFMTQLAEPLGYGLIDTKFEEKAAERAKQLRKAWDKVKQRVGDKASLQEKAVFEKVEKKRRAIEKKDWWAWDLDAEAEQDPQKREAIYREGLKQFPDSAELNGNFALFLDETRKDHVEAEKLYRKALELDPNLANTTGNFAAFLHTVRKDYDQAEGVYRKALELDQNHAGNTGNFALFLHNVRKDYDEAERLYRKALNLDPSRAINTMNVAIFMYEIRKNYDEAQRLFRKALDLDPDNLTVRSNYLAFLIVAGRFGEAKELSDGLWGETSAEVSGFTPIVALRRGLLLLFDGKDDVEALSRLKTSFQEGLHDETWSSEAVVSAAESRLDADNKKLYSAIAEAIRDPNKVAALDEFPRWKAATPIPLDEPWPPLIE